MAALQSSMTALQSSMTALSISSSNSFLANASHPLSILLRFMFDMQVKSVEKPCLIVMRLKRWERKECKPNSLPVLQKMHVRLGDTVKVIAGNEKGKIGEVIRLFKHNSTVIVKDMNIKTKHVKPKEQGEPGQIVKVEGPIHSSNVMLYSKEKEVHSRVGHKILEDGSRVRYLVKTGEIIDNKDDWKRVTKAKNKELEKVEA